MFHMKHKYRFLNRYLQLYVIDILAPDSINYHYTYLIVIELEYLYNNNNG